MADQIPPSPPGHGWEAWAYLVWIAAVGWVGDWLRARWQANRRPPEHQCHDECHHHKGKGRDEGEGSA
jgi:hypothetical protein